MNPIQREGAFCSKERGRVGRRVEARRRRGGAVLGSRLRVCLWAVAEPQPLQWIGGNTRNNLLVTVRPVVRSRFSNDGSRARHIVWNRG